MTNFLKGDENFARRIISPDENFTRQSFAHQYNHKMSKWLKSLVGSFVLHFKTLLFLLGETFCRAKVTNFSLSDENSARRKIRPTKFRPLRYYNSLCLFVCLFHFFRKLLVLFGWNFAWTFVIIRCRKLYKIALVECILLHSFTESRVKDHSYLLFYLLVALHLRILEFTDI